MRAPSTFDTVVVGIVGELCPADADASDRLSAEADVRLTIQYLQGLDTPVIYQGQTKIIPFRGMRRDNAEEFRTWQTMIKRMEKTVASTTSPALFAIFSGETDLHSDRIPSDEIQKKVIDRLRFFKSQLAWLKERCEFLLAERPGAHGLAGYRERRVAHEAWRMLRRFRKAPADGSADSLYGRVTSKLWEALTGEAGRDLQWACKTTLQLADDEGLQDV